MDPVSKSYLSIPLFLSSLSCEGEAGGEGEWWLGSSDSSEHTQSTGLESDVHSTRAVCPHWSFLMLGRYSSRFIPQRILWFWDFWLSGKLEGFQRQIRGNNILDQCASADSGKYFWVKQNSSHSLLFPFVLLAVANRVLGEKNTHLCKACSWLWNFSRSRSLVSVVCSASQQCWFGEVTQLENEGVDERGGTGRMDVDSTAEILQSNVQQFQYYCLTVLESLC